MIKTIRVYAVVWRCICHNLYFCFISCFTNIGLIKTVCVYAVVGRCICHNLYFCFCWMLSCILYKYAFIISCIIHYMNVICYMLWMILWMNDSLYECYMLWMMQSYGTLQTISTMIYSHCVQWKVFNFQFQFRFSCGNVDCIFIVSYLIQWINT